jgi:hypothetical protein
MTENPEPENRPGDLERHNTLRAWLIDALALGVGALAVFYYRPEGVLAGSSYSSALTPSRILCRV